MAGSPEKYRHVKIRVRYDSNMRWRDDEGNYYDDDDVNYDGLIYFVTKAAEKEKSAVADSKPSNPKDAIGVLKASMDLVPTPVLYGVSLAMLEGALKYGKFNYREVGVKSSVYIGALKRHVDSWEEGEDYDPDLEELGVQVSHLDKAIACLVILRDAMIRGKLEDDRRPASPKGWLGKFNEQAKTLIEAYKDKPKPVHYTEKQHPSGNK